MTQPQVPNQVGSTTRAVVWYRVGMPQLATLVVCMLLGVLVALLIAPTLERPLTPLLIDFYPTERNELIDYSFSEPQGYMLLPRPDAPSAVILRLFRPLPLPPQPVDVDFELRPLFTATVDATPRVWRVLVPSDVSQRSELLLGLRTKGTQGQADGRALGVLLDDVTLKPLTTARWSVWPSAVALVVGFAFVLGTVAYRRYARRLLSWHSVWAFTLLAAFVSITARYSIVRHARFGSNGYDLGQYDQILWLLSRGFEPYSTTMGLHILGNHAAFVLYLLAPLYVWPDVRLLLVFQCVVVALGALALYLLGRARGNVVAGLLAMAALLIHPATLNMLLFDFHPDAVAGAALLWALYSVERRRWALTMVCVVVLLACKENFALTGGVLGLWLLWRREWRVGATIAVLSAVWLVATTQFIQPYFNGQNQAIHLSRLSNYGTTPLEILATVVQRPGLVLGDLMRPASITYLLLLLLPFGLLPLLRPNYLVLAAPALTLNLLSNFPPQRTLAFHYDALIVAVAAFALLQTLLGITQWRARRGLLLAMASVAIVSGAWYTQTVTRSRIAEVQSELNSARQRHRIWRYAVTLIPEQVGVSAQSRFQPHLTHRRQAYLFPNPFAWALFYNPQAMPFAPDVDYVLFDTKLAADFELSAAQQRTLLEQLQQSGAYRQVVDLDGVVLLQRSGEGTTPPPLPTP